MTAAIFGGVVVYGAIMVYRAATLDAAAPSGTFQDANGVVPW